MEDEISVYYIVSSYNPMTDYSNAIEYCDNLEDAIECGIKNQRYRVDMDTGNPDYIKGSDDRILIKKITDLNRDDGKVIREEKTLREWLEIVA